MRRRYAIAVAALLLTMATMQEASAFWLSGNDLTKSCDGSPGLCLGYVVGVADVMSGPFWSDTKINACFPKGVPPRQLMAVVKKYLADYPQDLHGPAFGLVAIALALAFPCEKAQ
jgi:hypothetical protein